MSLLWRDWYHCNGNTYGTWVRGDSRGFRERSHREHRVGDYRQPPPQKLYETHRRQSRRLMRKSPIYLDESAQKVAGAAMVENLLGDGIELLVLALDDHHFHLLAKVTDRNPRHWIGRAKMHSSRLLSEQGLTGKVWAVRCRALPIEHREHQLRTYRYILKHREQGAWVWSFKD